MPDLATLGLRIESQEVATADQRLDNFEAAAGKAEKAADGLAAGGKRTAGAMATLEASIAKVERELADLRRLQDAAAVSAGGMTNAVGDNVISFEKAAAAQRRMKGLHAEGAAGARLQAHEVTNLGRQFADIGVMLGGGQSPFMTILTQGPQIIDIMHSSGLSAKAFAAEILAMAAPFAGVAVAAGVAVGAFALFAKHVDDNSKLALTWSDTWKATVKVVGDELMHGPIGDGLKWLGGAFAGTMSAIVDGTMAWLDRFVGFWGAAYIAVVKNWRNLPEVFATIAQAAVNNWLWAVEGMVNAVVKGVNKLAGKELLKSFDLPELKLVTGRIADDFSADMARIAGESKKWREGIVDKIVDEAERIHRASEKKAKATKAEADAMADLIKQYEALGRVNNSLGSAWQRAQEAKVSDTQLENAFAAQETARLKAKLLESLHVEEEMLRQRQAMAQTATERLATERALRANLAEQEKATKGWTAIIIESRRAAERADLEAAYSDFGGAMDDAARAISAGDWGSAVTAVLKAFETLRWSSLNTAGRIGAVAGLGSALGSAIGGTAGSALSGAASGLMAGAQIGSIIPGIGTVVGGAIGGMIGGITSLFGSSSKKKEEQRQREAAAAEAEAQRLAQIAADRRSLEIALMEAQGNAVGALAARRADELAAMDASNRALAQQIYALQDAQTAAEKAAQAAADAAKAAQDLADRLAQAVKLASDEVSAANAKVANARSALSEAYEREASALTSTRDRFQALAESLKTYGASLAAANDNAGGYASSRAAFLGVANGNSTSGYADLQSVSERFLEASKTNATDALSYRRDVAAVQRAVAAAQNSAQDEVDVASQQLSALQQSVTGLGILNSSVLSVRDAISALNFAQAQAGAAETVLENKPGYTNWASYLKHYPGVQAEWDNVISTDPSKRQWWTDAEDFAKWHYESSGKAAGWTPYAMGAVFTNGVVSQPTGFDASVMGEAGPEAVVPLVRGPEGLGVRMHGEGDDEEMLELLRAILGSLERIDTAQVQTTLNTSRAARAMDLLGQLFDRLSEGGDALRVTNADEADVAA